VGRLFSNTIPYYLVAPKLPGDPALIAAIGEATYYGNHSGMLGFINQLYQPPIDVLNIPDAYWPFCFPEESEQELYDILIELYRKWKILLNDSGLGPSPDPSEYPFLINSTYNWIKNRDYEELLPYGAMTFDEINSDFIAYTAMAATRYGGWQLRSVDTYNVSDVENIFPDIDRRGNIINIVHNAYANYLNPNPEQSMKITTFYQGFPQSLIFTFDISSIAGLFLYGFVSSLLLPVFIANLATDKQEKVLLMMQMSGLRMSIYWLVAYIYDMFLYALVFIVICVTSIAFKMRMFTQTNPLLLILFFFIWGNALISLCFFF